MVLELIDSEDIGIHREFNTICNVLMLIYHKCHYELYRFVANSLKNRCEFIIENNGFHWDSDNDILKRYQLVQKQWFSLEI